MCIRDRFCARLDPASTLDQMDRNEPDLPPHLVPRRRPYRAATSLPRGPTSHPQVRTLPSRPCTPRDRGSARIETDGGWLELVDLPPRSYDELGSTVIRPICTLLTLATGVRIRPSNVQLSPDSGTWWPVYSD